VCEGSGLRRLGSLHGAYRLVREPLASLIDEIKCVVWVLRDDEMPFDGDFQKRDRHGHRIGGTAILTNPAKQVSLDLVDARTNASLDRFSI
jgi:hypothetical protein